MDMNNVNIEEIVKQVLAGMAGTARCSRLLCPGLWLRIGHSGHCCGAVGGRPGLRRRY